MSKIFNWIKDYIAVLALLISGFSLYFSYSVHQDNKEFIDKANVSYLQIKDISKGMVEIGIIKKDSEETAEIIDLGIRLYIRLINNSNSKCEIIGFACKTDNTYEEILLKEIIDYKPFDDNIVIDYTQPLRSNRYIFPNDTLIFEAITGLFLADDNLTTNVHILFVYTNNFEIYSYSYLIQRITFNTTNNLKEALKKIDHISIVEEVLKIDDNPEIFYSILTNGEKKNLLNSFEKIYHFNFNQEFIERTKSFEENLLFNSNK